MKLLALATVLVSAMISPISEARSIRAYETSALSTVIIDGQKTDFVGRVTINNADSTIRVEYGHDMCGYFKDLPPGTVTCMAMPKIEGSFTVPAQKRQDSCGSIVISGVEDLRRADGSRTEITVMNHATRYCEDYRPYGIEVHVKTTSLFGEVKNYFLGK